MNRSACWQTRTIPSICRLLIPLVALAVAWVAGCGQTPAKSQVAANAPAAAPVTGPQTQHEPSADWPQVALAGGVVKMVVYLPDAAKGYYRGGRFDWSGQIARAEYKGHVFFNEWQTPHDPGFHDHVVGPAEEFGIADPPGYGETKVGECFLKIGVGVEKRKSDGPYSFAESNVVVKPGQWSVTHGDDWIEFRQNAAYAGFAYEYVKRLSITKSPAGFAIAHTLKNVGTKLIDTAEYCHNFVMIDGEMIGPNYTTTFGFDSTIAQQRGPARVDTKNNRFVIQEEMKPGEDLWALFKNGAASKEQNVLTIENTKSGGGLKIIGGEPTVKFVVYAQRTAICPEPFIAVHLSPGESKSWTTRYEFLDHGK